MKIGKRYYYRIDECRWQLGSLTLELHFNIKRPNVGFYLERGGYDSDRKGGYLALGPLKVYWHVPTPYVKDSRRVGFDLDWNHWQRWFGDPDGEDVKYGGNDRVFCMWRSNLLDAVFGRTVFARQLGKKTKVVIDMPEGGYEATAQFEWCIWCRPRWPFRKMRLETDMDCPKGLPFSGKGENSWDCGDDGLHGWSVEGHDIQKAIRSGIDSCLKSRSRYGEPSEYRTDHPVAP